MLSSIRSRVTSPDSREYDPAGCERQVTPRVERPRDVCVALSVKVREDTVASI